MGIASLTVQIRPDSAGGGFADSPFGARIRGYYHSALFSGADFPRDANAPARLSRRRGDTRPRSRR